MSNLKEDLAANGKEATIHVDTSVRTANVFVEFLRAYSTGVIGGMARAVTGHPFDTVKVKMQTNPDKYKNSMQCLRMIVDTDGPKGLFKGLTPPLIGNMGIVATHFSVYNTMKNEHNVSSFLAGAIAGSCGSLLSTPVEFIRIKMQLASKMDNNKQYSGAIDCMRKIIAANNNNPFALYRGFSVTIAREFIGYGSFFYAYNAIKSPTGIKLVDDSIRGIACGFALWGSMFPIDVIKSRLQGAKLEDHHHSVRWHVQDVYSRYGVRGFLSGFVPTMVRAIPVNIAIVMAVDMTKKLLNE